MFFVVLEVIMKSMWNLFFYLKNKRIPFYLAVASILIFGGGFTFWFKKQISQTEYPLPAIKIIQPIVRKPETEEKKERPRPGPVSIDIMKTKGCVADGLLSGYGGDTEGSVKLINRSNCRYLHRAIETWASPPDFELADELMWDIQKPNMIYGMFIAEAIKKNADYYFPDEERYFKFSEMCRGHSDNAYGEHTCIPSFKKEEYREYLKYITRKAMDLGVQSFLFGQIYLQDPSKDRDHSDIYDIVGDMRKYAKKKNMDIIVGAQTNSITNEKYLRLFDYIEGGVGVTNDGNVEDGPCWSKKESCWALLWNERFSKKANNVFLHLDWSGLLYDDMSVFARMDKDKRAKTLGNLYQYFTSRNMGFMMPYLATIHRQNGGCYGPKKRFYSPDNKFTCKDEDVIKEIMGK